MPPRAKTLEEVVDGLLNNAIQNGACLECHLSPSMTRPGRFRHYIMVGGRGGKRWRASRLVWTVKKGPIPDGLCVLHTCDNELCINPKHLFLGTFQDNTDDMISKGRKIDDPTVGPRRRLRTATAIFNSTWEGLSDDQICNKLFISKTTLWNYRKGPYSLTLFAGD